MQVEAPDDPVGEGGQVGLAVLSVSQRLERLGQRVLQVTQYGIDPVELGQILRLEGTHHAGDVDAAGFGDCGEAAQAVAEDEAAGLQAGLGPLADGLGGEAADHIELHVRRPTVVIRRQRRHERHLVLRATARLAARAFSTEVGVVQLHCAVRQVSGLPIGHGAIDFLVQQPSGGVAYAQIMLEGQRRDPRLGLADEKDGQKPSGQRQLGMLHHRAGRHRSLMPAAQALEQLASALLDEVVPRVVAARASEALDPASPLQSFGALLLGAEVTQEFGDRHAGLQLNVVAEHRCSSSLGELRL